MNKNTASLRCGYSYGTKVASIFHFFSETVMAALTLTDDALFERVTMIMDEKIRPFIERDGGKITFHSIDKGIVFVQLSGACSTCSAAQITLKAGVERILRKEIRDVKSVQLHP